MRSFERLAITAALAVPAILMAMPAAGEASSADKPALKVGDYWVYQRSQTRPPVGDAASPTFRREIVEVTPDGNLRTGGRPPNLYDASLNVIPASGPDNMRKLFRFPLAVGQTWTWSRRVYPTQYPDVEERGDFRVVAYEPITVPAGALECFKIVGDTTTSGRYIGSYEKVQIWYCPSVRHMARQVVEHRDTKVLNAGVGLYNTTTIELLETSYITK